MRIAGDSCDRHAIMQAAKMVNDILKNRRQLEQKFLALTIALGRTVKE
jgi:hypothetical protein